MRHYYSLQDYSDPVPFDQSEVVNDRSYLAPEFFDKEHERELEKIDDGIQAAQALDEIKHVYDEDFHAEGSDPSIILNAAVEHLLSKLCTNHRKISTETLKNTKTQATAKRFIKQSIESSIGNFFQKVGQVIIGIISKIISNVWKFLKWITGNGDKSATAQIQVSKENDQKVIVSVKSVEKTMEHGTITDADRKNAEDTKQKRIEAEKRLMDFFNEHADKISDFCHKSGNSCTLDEHALIDPNAAHIEIAQELTDILNAQVNGIRNLNALRNSEEELEQVQKKYLDLIPRFGKNGQEYKLDFVSSIAKVSNVGDITLPDGMEFTKLVTVEVKQNQPALVIKYKPENKDHDELKEMVVPAARWKPALPIAREFITKMDNLISPIVKTLHSNQAAFETVRKQIEEDLKSQGAAHEQHNHTMRVITQMAHHDLSSMLLATNLVLNSLSGITLLNKYIDLCRDYFVAADSEELNSIVEI